MKKVSFVMVLLVALLICVIPNVKAEDFYYINPNGVEFDEEQYSFFTEMFWEGYQEYVTQEEFDKVDELGLVGSNIERETIFVLPEYSVYTPSVTQNGRTTTITKACSTQCLNTLSTIWQGTPTVQSIDVVGARVSGGSLGAINSALVSGTNYAQVYSSPDTQTNGFGYSIQVPNTTNIKITLSFYTSLNSTTYATYQHAMRNISVANSKLYTIAYYGYGGVFNFYGAAAGVYDACNGVDL